MKHDIAVLSLAFLSATAAYSQVTLNTTPSRSVGQPLANPESSNPNLVEGRELYSPEGIALDASVSPAILYVSDTRNNRVLGWKNALSFTNGQPADLVIGQQDFYATDPQGPGQKFSIGLNSPTGLAVNSAGDLYVIDTNNNRVLRFRTPFQHVGSTPAAMTTPPDLYIGQPSLTSRTANYTGQVSAQGLSLSGYPANMAFDSGGNLWICDTFNYRVLRFPAASLNATGGAISADIVIGQQSLTSVNPTLLQSNATSQQNTNQFAVLGGIGLDPQGRLYVGDSLARVLVFANPTAVQSNASADRLMGVFPAGTPTPTPTTQGVTEFNSPEGIFFIPDGTGNAYVGVVDANWNRATIFQPYSQWPAAPAPPQAVQPGGVIGQSGNFTLIGPNNNSSTTAATPIPANNTLYGPIAAAYLNSSKELFIADANNNRVIVMPLLSQAGSPPVNFGNATRVLGQAQMNQFSINYIEGKEFQFSFQSGSSVTYDAGIALDTTGTTPHLYIADPYNNRVLGFKDARKISPNLHADIVIGQPDFGTATCNPTGDSTKPTRSSLCRPYGLAVDPQGNLYVADSANGRVLRFPAPFSYNGSPGTSEPADLVLGQQDFTTQVLDPTASTMKTPYGLAFSGTNGLLVSDIAFNRVLYFKFTSAGSFKALTDNGIAANKVYGQLDFFSILPGSSSSQLSAPHHVSADTSGRPYVADTGNNRILIFDDPNSPSTSTTGDPAPLALTGLNAPRGIYVNPTTGELWVANTNSAAVVRYPAYDTLIFNQTALTTISDAATDPGQNGLIGLAPVALVQDQFGDLFVADSANRVITYYENLTVVNGASFLPNAVRLLAPGTIASIFPAKNGSASQFGAKTSSFTDLANPIPVPNTLGDIQVTVNGTQAPIFYISPGQINFVIPTNAPTTGTAEVDVIQASTGQILGAGLINMASVSPGIFQCPASAAALRQACVLNEDNSVNSFTNAAQRGHVIQIYGTGEGLVPNSPADGVPPTSAVPSPFSPRVIMNGQFTDAYPLQPGDPANGQFVQYFGLAPGLLGVWQLNVQIPMGVPPNNTTQLEVLINNVSDTDVNSVDPNTGKVFHMSFAVK